MDEPLETSPQRLRDHLRRPTLPNRQLTMPTAGYTVNPTVPFGVLMDAVRICSLGQITDALFDVGGRYRRNI